MASFLLLGRYIGSWVRSVPAVSSRLCKEWVRTSRVVMRWAWAWVRSSS